MATYAAMVDCVDQGVGEVMRTLEDLGLLKNNPGDLSERQRSQSQRSGPTKDLREPHERHRVRNRAGDDRAGGFTIE